MGYTDRLGSDDYNDKLSVARARSMQDYLQSLRVTSASPVTQGRGKFESARRDCSANASCEQQISCLQPDRHATIDVTGAARESERD